MKQGEDENSDIGFNMSIGIEFHGSRVTSDGGLLAHQDHDDGLGLFDSVSTVMNDRRTGRNL